MVVCPFEILTYEYKSAFSPRIMKCTICHYTRIVKGQIPACVESCPLGALIFGKRNNLIRLAKDRSNRKTEEYVDYVYGEE